ncbi:dicarboxylate/amino acid:cation symporter [Hathewaya limosa]|uniref:Na+/H+-dicarboxylate symporter n=1 Tax=Hathewaya limosa TaxID=1536 RepID=A0ABU0JUP0_HATLI|nr:dicarboxylate/amino acid:cation symporter [Hathewaya limosa]MDQ0479828.1 Na+/H+-dicarboxylate symporter [Hathewaya limosa]
MKKLGLLPKLILAIILGLFIGAFTPKFIVQGFATFNGIFGTFLKFCIPLIILGFVVCGIADLGKGVGKLLGITTLLAYGSTLFAGLFAFVVSKNIFPLFIHTTETLNNAGNPEEKLLKPFFEISMPPIMDVMSALILAFLLGIGISAIKDKGKALYNMAYEFQSIIQKLIKSFIIPLLPIHIMGIFANMTYTGEVFKILSVFWKVFLIVLVMHLIVILIQFIIASIVGRKNLFTLLRNQIPAYLTAIGTQSSAAAIPVNLQSAEKNGVSKGIREFVIPLCATIHLSGSTITLTSCAIALMYLNNMPFSVAKILSFVAMLGITMVAAPGVPGGAVMAALGTLESILGFTSPMLSLMIALYITQDSFGTACNISGDNAIALIVDKFNSTLKSSRS